MLSPWILLSILGESSIHINSQLLELEPISSLVCDTPALIRSNASFDSHCSSMSDKRVDPTTGEAVTYKELVATYKKQYKRQEIEDRNWPSGPALKVLLSVFSPHPCISCHTQCIHRNVLGFACFVATMRTHTHMHTILYIYNNTFKHIIDTVTVRACVYPYIYVYVYVYISAYVSAYVYVHGYACACAYVYAYVHVYVFACTYVCTCICKHHNAKHAIKHFRTCLPLFCSTLLRIIGRAASQQSPRSRRQRRLQRSPSPRRLPSLSPRQRQRQRQPQRMARRRRSRSQKPRLPLSRRQRRMTRPVPSFETPKRIQDVFIPVP